MYLNDGSGHFSVAGVALPEPLRTPTDVFQAVALADADSDGDLDIAAGIWGGLPDAPTQHTRLLLNDGHATFSFAPASAIPDRGDPQGTFAPRDIHAADVDGDGTTDLVVAVSSVGWSEASVRLYLGNGDGTYRDAGEVFPHDWDVGQGNAVLFVRTADIDGDDRLDVLTMFTSLPRVFVQRDDLAFRDVTESLASEFVMQTLLPGDLDGDGDTDLVAVFAEGTRVGTVFRAVKPFPATLPCVADAATVCTADKRFELKLQQALGGGPALVARAQVGQPTGGRFLLRGPSGERFNVIPQPCGDEVTVVSQGPRDETVTLTVRDTTTDLVTTGAVQLSTPPPPCPP